MRYTVLFSTSKDKRSSYKRGSSGASASKKLPYAPSEMYSDAAHSEDERSCLKENTDLCSTKHLIMDNIQVLRYCRERLAELCPHLSPTLIDELSLGWRVLRFGRREHLALAGSIQPEAFMVVQGLARAYYPTADEDITINFIAEGDFATHYTSLEQPRVSHFSFQAIEPTTVVAFSYEYVYQLSLRRIDTERLLRLLLEYEYSRLMTHTECLLIRSAEDRYRLFRQHFGHLLTRISITDLSSYLGVSRQNLTLIRKRLLND